MAYEINLEELLQLSQSVPSLLTSPSNHAILEQNCTGRHVVCMHTSDYATRNAKDLGILEYYGKKVTLKGTKNKQHSDGPTGEAFVKSYNIRKKITETRRPSMVCLLHDNTLCFTPPSVARSHAGESGWWNKTEVYLLPEEGHKVLGELHIESVTYFGNGKNIKTPMADNFTVVISGQ